MYPRCKSLVKYMTCESFLPFCGLSLHFLETQKFLILMKSDVSFFFFSFVACAFAVLSQKALPKPWSQRFHPMFSSMSLTVLVLLFRSTMHFELFFVYGV